jgi:hypothetical protein
LIRVTIPISKRSFESDGSGATRMKKWKMVDST